MLRAVKTADYLLVDVSNSFTKTALASTARIGRSQRVATAELSSRYIRALLAGTNARRLIVSSVVPAKNVEIASAAGDRPVLWLSARINLGVGVDYPAPQSIGADRLANAAAVTELYGWPAVVVDFGTAVTFDIVSAQRRYVGGVIAPGLEAMTSFLYQRTALLPKLSLKEPSTAVGKSTLQAMRAGAVYGYRGLVREIVTRIKAELFRNKRVRVVATGGYASLIARQLSEIEAVHRNLTLEGLRIVGNLNPV